MTGGEVGLLMLGLFILTIMLGFPIAFTLMAVGVFFGYWAYATPDQLDHIFQNRIFDLLVQNTFSILSNDVLTAVPLFLFMGHMAFAAGVSGKAFRMATTLFGHVSGGLAISTIFACSAFAMVSGSSVAPASIMALVAIPEMLRFG